MDRPGARATGAGLVPRAGREDNRRINASQPRREAHAQAVDLPQRTPLGKLGRRPRHRGPARHRLSGVRLRGRDGARVRPCGRGRPAGGRNNPSRLSRRGGRDRPGLRGAVRAGARRHGRRLPGPPGPPQAGGGPEDAPGRGARRGAGAGPLPRRGGGGGAADAPEHRPGLRGRRARRPPLLLPGVRRRRQPGPGAGRRPAAARPGGAAPGDARAGRTPRPPTQGGTPRPEAGERPADGGRHPQGHRLRPRQATRRGPGSNPDRRGHGHAELHGPGTGDGEPAGDRPAHRRLRPRRRPVRGAYGPPPVPGGERARDARTGVRPGAGAAEAAASEGAARPGHDLPQVPAQGAPPALRQCGSAGGRPAALPGRRADPGPSRGGTRARPQEGRAPPRRLRPGRGERPVPAGPGRRYVATAAE